MLFDLSATAIWNGNRVLNGAAEQMVAETII